MWIPTPFYQRAPHYWLLLGLSLIIVGVYLGLEIQRSYLYVGVGVGLACCLWSLRVFSARSKARQDSSQSEPLPTDDVT